MAISLVFDGHVRNVDNLGLNVFVTFTIAAATELPADTFLTVVLDRWGRRWLACGSLVVSGIFSIWASAVSNSVYHCFIAHSLFDTDRNFPKKKSRVIQIILHGI